MTQREYTEIIEQNLERYYSDIDLREKVSALTEAIKYCRLFKEEYSKDYKHKFFGKWIDFSEVVLDEMDKMVINARSIISEDKCIIEEHD